MTVNFKLVESFAQRAAMAYNDPDTIQAAYPKVEKVGGCGKKLRYFLETDHRHRTHTVTVRGTCNLTNAIEDFTYIYHKSHRLPIWVHKGFDDCANAVYQSLQPLLHDDYDIVLTGHSLGAAISTLLLMYFFEDGRKIRPSINFGQPMVTNGEGVKRYETLPLMRIVDENDVVPLLPANDILDELHGGFKHVGDQVILLKDQFYVFEPTQEAEHTSAWSFWKNVLNTSMKAHFMENYLANIRSKFEHSETVPFEQRQAYYSKQWTNK